MWNAAALDLDSYLARTGHAGPLEPTLGTLRALTAAHQASIPFENLDLMLGRPIEVDLPSIQRKLVTARRGGYCYEHNQLFAAVLERLGFDVAGRSARVQMGSTDLRPATHATLVATVDGQPHLVDVGFGANCLRAPLPLTDGASATQDGWYFRLDRGPRGEWVLSSAASTLYAFTDNPQYPVDYLLANHYTSTHPNSHFTQRIVVQRSGAGIRHSLVADQLTTTYPDRDPDQRTITRTELPGLLAETFALRLDPDELARLPF